MAELTDVSISAIYLISMFLINLSLAPLVLRATILQNFAGSFDLRFIKDFIARTSWEMMLSILFMAGVGVILMILTVITCYVGGILAASVAIFAWQHLQKQID